MRAVRLDHTTINTADIDATVDFFAEYLGLRPGFRPDFGMPGAWLYPHDGDYPIVHLIGVQQPPSPGGCVDHVAFRGEDLRQYVEKLRANNQEFSVQPVAETPLSQVHHHDPNGVKIEVTFQEPVPADL